MFKILIHSNLVSDHSKVKKYFDLEEIHKINTWISVASLRSLWMKGETAASNKPEHSNVSPSLTKK